MGSFGEGNLNQLSILVALVKLLLLSDNFNIGFGFSKQNFSPKLISSVILFGREILLQRL